ncbi:MAG TPA: xanthine dehydrogenase family protein molybdopterin-binding subunit, partial [Burkholderiales bacterium]|nr:xanthine dehydrogenase family protein molybdopterin-binding subunit [Burkholderiales bacterium]
MRVEDERFLTGRGRYVADLAPPGTLFAQVLRSPHAHARILRLDARTATAAPGVATILTGVDAVREGIGTLPCGAFPALPPGSRFHRPERPIVALERVRHVGEPVALVVAETPAHAADAAELIEVDYEALPAVTLEDALRPGAPRVWDDAADNVAFELERGEREAVARAFANAAHVTRIALTYPRASANAIEPRAVLALAEAGRATLYTSAQSPFQVREVLAGMFGLAEPDLRVVAPDVGGAFGMKSDVYPEEALVLWAARRLGRPVKWTADRRESLASDMHGRHQIAEAELALDASGRAAAMRVSVAIDLGAYLGHHAGVAPQNAAISYTNTYDVPLIHTRVRACFTNTCVVGPYRGTAKPEATFVTERLFDKAARELGVDLVELRRRNLIAPSAMPYRTPGGYVFDSGEFERVLDRALHEANWADLARRRAESERRGLRRGIGLALHCQRAGSQSERMEIRLAADGSAAVYAGTLSTGQGHETVFAALVSEWLGVPASKVRLFQGDTGTVLYGRGTYAQRSMNAGGSALKLAAEEVIRKGRRFAGWMLEAAEADIEFAQGVFRVQGTDRQVSLREVARRAYGGAPLPPELGIGLDGAGTHPGPNNFPNGCMICEVEVDPDTGAVALVGLTAVDDVGVALHPALLEGQLHGSVAQGLGAALLEEVVYERGTGQLLTGSFMDYAMPRAADFPQLHGALHLVPTRTNLLGAKGGSEAGNVGVPPAVVHAIIDALAPWGVSDVPLPAT